MNIKFPFVYGGKMYDKEEFYNNFICSECGAGLAPSEDEIVCFFNREHSGIKLRETKKMDKLPVKLDEITTLTGIKIADAILMMNERLDDAAYKEYSPTNSRAFTLTDISPAYLLEKLNEILGPPGLGWRYEFDTSSVECDSAGGSFFASVIGFRLYYTLVWGGEPHEIGPILSTGGSKNSKKEYALKGAITNALGTAAYRGLNWQIDVYKGQRTHLGDSGDTQSDSSGKSSLSFVDAASLHLKSREIALSDSRLAPVAQYQLLKSLDENAIISSLPELVTKPIAAAIKANLIKLMTIAECEVQFSEDLFDKPMGELTIGEFRMFWTALAMIAGGDKREEVTKRMKAIRSG